MYKERENNPQSWKLLEDGTYARLATGNNDFSAHGYFITNPSLSGRGSAVDSSDQSLQWVLER